MRARRRLTVEDKIIAEHNARITSLLSDMTLMLGFMGPLNYVALLKVVSDINIAATHSG